MRRLPMWLGVKVQDDAEAKVYEVVRLRDYPGYPNAPHVEGRIAYHRTPPDSEPNEGAG